jgi:hydroxymethylglutaryl-CoA synthase
MDRMDTDEGNAIVKEIGTDPALDINHIKNLTPAEQEKAKNAYRRLISKTLQYQHFTKEKIEKTQKASALVGNQYTGSIFLALMSTLEIDMNDQTDLNYKKIGFCAYGSGAKSKVFQGIVQPGWDKVVKEFDLFDRLSKRKAIDAKTYEALHRGFQKNSVETPANEFVLKSVGGSNVLHGHRKYTWIN